MEVLRDKTGSDSKPKEFNRMLRKVVGADQLPNYTMQMATTADGSSATLFRLRGEAEALALTAKLEAEQERRHRFDADRRRTSEMDDLMDRLAKKHGLSWDHTPKHQSRGSKQPDQERFGSRQLNKRGIDACAIIVESHSVGCGITHSIVVGSHTIPLRKAAEIPHFGLQAEISSGE